MPNPHKSNVPGDFYVEDGCCMCCDVPMIEAPHLFEYETEEHDAHHCFVCRQPSNDRELDDMLRTITRSETECIFYGGNDPAILQRMGDIGMSHLCDAVDPAPPSTKPWWRFW